MEIQITYETLFDLLRKERSLDELQPLQGAFWNQVVQYILDREQHVAKATSFEQEKGRIQLLNIKRIIKEIYERREQKIVRLALNVTRTKTGQYIDKRNMLASEQAFFDEQVQLLKKFNQGVLLQIFNGHMPIIAPTILGESEDIPSLDTTSDHRTSEITTAEETETPVTPSQEPTKEEAPITITKTGKPTSTPEAKVGSIIVRFTSNVPKFVGKNKELFGPFEQGKIVQLPANIAQILLKKGKVEHVMAEH
jgi:DNA replication initiation complex subunit (GINS family)